MPETFYSSFSIKTLTVGTPLVLAPMADFTHAAFRELVAGFGGCGLFYTEMLNARVVATQPLEKDPYCRMAEKDRPLVAQLVGNDPERMGRAAARLEDLGVDAVDINMGCSRQKIMRFGWGLSLMDDLLQAEKVISAVRAAVDLPLLVKLRSAREHDVGRLLEVGSRLAELGVDAFCLHPRSAGDGFKRPARWAEIGELSASLAIPVIGNGDIACREDALRMLKETRCQGVMIGRAALVRPWIFAEIAAGYQWDGDVEALLHRYLDLLHRYLPEEMVESRFLLFCSWFFRNWPFYMSMLQRMGASRDPDHMIATVVSFVYENEQTMVGTPFIGRI
jgi:tRNA-dihydrouridine synthase B